LIKCYVPENIDGSRILDICGGRGDLALVLGNEFPSSTVTIMDKNKQGLMQAEYRADMLGLKNVVTSEIDLFDPNLSTNGSWDIVIGLHACGQLTDIVLENFKHKCSHLFIATCCFGKMSSKHKYSSFADADVGGVNTETSRLAKLIINSQRCTPSERFLVFEMDEASFSSKNQIIYHRNIYSQQFKPYCNKTTYHNS
jgi:hypothetical protein